MLSKRFPYAVYYELKDEIAYVVAVLPMRRDPLWIKKRQYRKTHTVNNRNRFQTHICLARKHKNS